MAQTFSREKGLRGREMGKVPAFRVNLGSESQLYYLLVKVKVTSLSHVRLFATPWTIAHQAPLSMGFSGQEYWSGLPFPSPGDLPDPGIEPGSPALQADALSSEPPGKPKSLLKEILYTLVSEVAQSCPTL